MTYRDEQIAWLLGQVIQRTHSLRQTLDYDVPPAVITFKVNRLVDAAQSIAELCTCTEERLAEIQAKEDAQLDHEHEYDDLHVKLYEAVKEGRETEDIIRRLDTLLAGPKQTKETNERNSK